MTATGTSVERVPDGTGSLYVGTSGWSYPSWRPDFYPTGLRNEEFLRFYAGQLETVELAPSGPNVDRARRWLRDVVGVLRDASG